MKKVKKSTENCHFYSRVKSLYIAWACFRNDWPFGSGKIVLKDFKS